MIQPKKREMKVPMSGLKSEAWPRETGVVQPVLVEREGEGVKLLCVKV
jgi:hypothetical protein